MKTSWSTPQTANKIQLITRTNKQTYKITNCYKPINIADHIAIAEQPMAIQLFKNMLFFSMTLMQVQVENLIIIQPDFVLAFMA